MKALLPPTAALAAALLLALSYYSLGVLVPEAGGQWPFDYRVTGYSAQEAQGYLAALSARGRAVYLLEVRMLDSAFPVTLAAALGLAAWKVGARWFVLPAALYAGLDLWENVLVSRLLRGGSERFDPQLAEVASAFTVGKYAALICAAGLLAALWLRRSRAVAERE